MGIVGSVQVVVMEDAFFCRGWREGSFVRADERTRFCCLRRVLGFNLDGFGVRLRQ